VNPCYILNDVSYVIPYTCYWQNGAELGILSELFAYAFPVALRHCVSNGILLCDD